ncbi:MAG: energy transducer TonB, partial [Sphingobacteriales bacterium]
SNNVPSGTWKLWDQDSLQFECSFEAGNMVRPKLHRKVATNSYVKRDEAFKRSAKYDVTPGGDTIFTTVEQSPEFPGGQSGLNRYVAENLKYPKEAKEHDIEGKVLVKITILDDGSVDPTDIKLERSLGYGTDEEIIRLIKNMPKWKPAKLNGWPVKNVYTLPINFKLQ